MARGRKRDRRYYTVEEVADKMMFTPEWIRKLCKRRDIPGARQPSGWGGDWKILKETFDPWFEKRMEG